MIKNDKVLILDDDQIILKLYEASFKKHDIITICVDSIEKASKALIENDSIKIIISDYMFPQNTTASEFLKGVHAKFPQIPIILLTGLGFEKIDADNIVYYDILLLKKQNLTKDYIIFLVTKYLESNNYEIFNDFKSHSFQVGSDLSVKVVSKEFPKISVAIRSNGFLEISGIHYLKLKKLGKLVYNTIPSMAILALKYAGISSVNELIPNLNEVQKNKKFTSDLVIADFMEITRQKVQRERFAIDENEFQKNESYLSDQSQ